MRKKNLISIVLMTAVLAVSCKKDPTDIPIGTISAAVEGTTTDFKVNAKATRLSVQNGFGIKISGYKKDPSLSGTNLEVIIVRPSQITVGNYVENPGDNPLVELNHFQEFILGSGTIYSNFHSNAHPVTVSISEINGTSVKGTFSGELKVGGLNGSTTTAMLTNGVFNVSF